MRQKIPLPPADKLRDLFEYNGETGVLYWRSRRKGVNAGMVAGVLSKGYIVVRIDGVLFRAHRIIWKLVTGEDPIDQIDHKDLNRANNAWDNLRQVDNSQNMMNASLPKRNTSGVKGVFWDTYAGKWRARIKLNQKNYHVGVFDNIDDAAKEIQIARERLHGEFARAA